MVRIRRILCPVDFFPASERAAEYAITLAKQFKATVILLHVVAPLSAAAYETVANTDAIMGAMRLAAREELKRLARAASAIGVRAEIIVRTGEVDFVIRSTSQSKNADFIVMGTHGRRGLERFFIGSVTERLLRRASVPLLTIGGPKTNGSPSKIRRLLVATDFSDGT